MSIDVYKSPSKLKEIYEERDIVSEYDKKRFFDPLSRFVHLREVRAVNKVLLTNKPDKILEVAVGTGRVARLLENVKSAVALDNSEAMISSAKKVLDSSIWELKQGDIFNPDIKKESFELVYTFRFIRHFPYDSRVRIYQSIYKLLKSKGLFMFEALNANTYPIVLSRFGVGRASIVDRPIYDELWQKDQLVKELKDAGFTNIELIPVLSSRSLLKIDRFLFVTKINGLIKRVPFLRGFVANAYIKMDRKPDEDKAYEWVVKCNKI